MKMSWVYVIASVFWGAAAVSVIACFLVRAARGSAAKALAGTDRRSFPRPPLGFRATLNLNTAEGETVAYPVRGYDLTRFGAMVISKQPVPPGSVVVLDLPSYHLIGVGHIRHCKPRRNGFSVGMQFRNPLMRSYEGEWTFAVVNR